MKESKSLPMTNKGMCELSDEDRDDLKDKYKGKLAGPHGPIMEDINELPNTRSVKRKEKSRG